MTTAWHGLTGRADLKPGEWLAVIGTGGVGLSAVMLGRAMGARVVAVDLVPEKLELAKAEGAEATVCASGREAAEAVRDITGGGAHVAIEALGITATADTALRCLRKMGRMIPIGLPAGDHATQALPWDVLYAGQLSVHGTRGMPAWRYPSLLSLIEGGLDLSGLVSRRIGLSDVGAELSLFDGAAPAGVAVINRFEGAPPR